MMDVEEFILAGSLDRRSTKARLPIKFFDDKSPMFRPNRPCGCPQLHIGEPIIVFSNLLPKKGYICIAWPQYEGETFAEVDTFVSFPISSIPYPVESTSSHPKECLSIFKLSKLIFSQSRIELQKTSNMIPKAFSIHIRFFGDAMKNSNTNLKKEQIRALLDGKFVMKGSMISENEEESGIEIVSIFAETEELKNQKFGIQLDQSSIYKLEEIFGPSLINRLTIVEIDTSTASVASNQTFEHHHGRNNDRNSMLENASVGDIHLDQVGGMKFAKQSLVELIQIPLQYSDVVKQLGISVPKGILLYGPPGVGKSFLVQQVAKTLRIPILSISASDIFSALLGQSEQHLRDIFAKADEMMMGGIGNDQFPKQDARESFMEISKSRLEKYKFGGQSFGGVIIFIDEIDAICSKRGDGSSSSSGLMESRIVAQLLTLLEETRAIVVAATNRPNHLDTALRRPGRFDREIEVPLPDEEERFDIFQKVSANMKFNHSSLEVHFSQKHVEPTHATHFEELSTSLFKYCASRSHGYSGADISLLLREATMYAIKRNNHFSAASDLHSTSSSFINPNQDGVTKEDLDFAFGKVKPSGTRGFAVEVPKTTWSDIGGLQSVKIKLQMMVEWPVLHKDSFERLGLSIPKGVLLYGPPGCSKTTLVKACANACKASFIPVNGADVYSPYLGESEKTIRDLFKKARQTAPCIIFFDEIDAMVSKRGSGGSSTCDPVSGRILTQLLTEMDGVESLSSSKSSSINDFNQSIIVIAATNRPDQLDSALLRPGRFDQLIEIPIPDFDTRLEIMKVLTRNTPISIDTHLRTNDTDSIKSMTVEESLSMVAGKTEGFSGADLKQLIHEAGILALKEDMNASFITTSQMMAVIENVRPSLKNYVPNKPNPESSSSKPRFGFRR